MAKKYRRKHNRVLSTINILIIITAIMIFFGVGYSAFSSELKILSTVRLKGNNEMPVDPEPGIIGGTDYVSLTVDNSALDILEQTIEGNTVNVKLKTTTNTGKPRGMNLSFSFSNGSNKTFTNGTVNFVKSGNTAFVPQNPTLSVTPTLEPGEEGSVTAKFTGLKFNQITTTVVLTFKVTYMAEGVPQEFNIVLNITN